MKRRTLFQSTAILGAAAILLFAMARAGHGQGTGGDKATPPIPAPGKYVDKDGTIHLPEDYRLKWTHLGSWYDEATKDSAGSMHDVYAEPEAVAAFRATGKWADGSTIVKEIRAARSGAMTTGPAHWDGEIIQWFVMVKDGKKTFPDNPSWGRGWGWGLFSINDPAKNISTDYKIDCLGCHVPAKKTDWIYTHAYPTLFERDGPFKKYPKENYNTNN